MRSLAKVVLVVAVLGLMALALAGCSSKASITGSDPVVTAAEPAPQVAPPARMDGYFATARSAGDWAPGSTTIIVPSWGEDAAAAARALEAGRSFALVSAHHCFGGPRSAWDACWEKTRAWMAPIERTGRLLGVYVLDEPSHNGVPDDAILAAVATVRAAGYRTMIAETYARYAGAGGWKARGFVPPVDWFGLTAYDTPAGWVADRYREDSRLNVAFILAGDAVPVLPVVGVFRWSLDIASAHGGFRRLP